MPTLPWMATVFPLDCQMQGGLFYKVRTEDNSRQSQSLHVSHHPKSLFRPTTLESCRILRANRILGELKIKTFNNISWSPANRSVTIVWLDQKKKIIQILIIKKKFSITFPHLVNYIQNRWVSKSRSFWPHSHLISSATQGSQQLAF